MHYVRVAKMKPKKIIRKQGKYPDAVFEVGFTANINSIYNRLMRDDIAYQFMVRVYRAEPLYLPRLGPVSLFAEGLILEDGTLFMPHQFTVERTNGKAISHAGRDKARAIFEAVVLGEVAKQQLMTKVGDNRRKDRIEEIDEKIAKLQAEIKALEDEKKRLR